MSSFAFKVSSCYNSIFSCNTWQQNDLDAKPITYSSPKTSALYTGHGDLDILSFMNPAFSIPGDELERRSFDVFRTQFTSQFSGYFDGWFWNTVVLQASHQEPTIRHAILALSGLVQRVRLDDQLPPVSVLNAEGTFALQHYNLAIRELKSSARDCTLSLDVCLITCLLFISFEVSRSSLYS